MTEYEKWNAAQYPYDDALCGYCATQHGDSMCSTRSHIPMSEAAAALPTPVNRKDRKIRAAFIAFRKRFAKFYPKRKAGG